MVQGGSGLAKTANGPESGVLCRTKVWRQNGVWDTGPLGKRKMLGLVTVRPCPRGVQGERKVSDLHAICRGLGTWVKWLMDESHPALRRLMQEDYEFKASPGYVVSCRSA